MTSDLPGTRPLTPFEGMDIRTLIHGWAGRRADHPFLIWAPFEGDDATWTYAAIADRCRRFPAGLTQRGVAPGDRVVIHNDNAAEFILA